MQVSELITRLQKFDGDCVLYLFVEDAEYVINEVLLDEEDYGDGEKIVWIKGVG